MLRRNTLVVALAAALLLPAIADCLIQAAQDAHAMHCCTHLSCAPGNLEQACYPTTAPAGGSQSAPEVRTSLVAPSVSADLDAPAEALTVVAFGSADAADAPQHSPPELYTLHLALLI